MNTNKKNIIVAVFSSLIPMREIVKTVILCFLIADSGSESGSHKSSVRGKANGPGDGKPTRVRTVLNEKQLHTLR